MHSSIYVFNPIIKLCIQYIICFMFCETLHDFVVLSSLQVIYWMHRHHMMRKRVGFFNQNPFRCSNWLKYNDRIPFTETILCNRFKLKLRLFTFIQSIYCFQVNALIYSLLVVVSPERFTNCNQHQISPCVEVRKKLHLPHTCICIM